MCFEWRWVSARTKRVDSRPVNVGVAAGNSTRSRNRTIVFLGIPGFGEGKPTAPDVKMAERALRRTSKAILG